MATVKSRKFETSTVIFVLFFLKVVVLLFMLLFMLSLLKLSSSPSTTNFSSALRNSSVVSVSKHCDGVGRSRARSRPTTRMHDIARQASKREKGRQKSTTTKKTTIFSYAQACVVRAQRRHWARHARALTLARACSTKQRTSSTSQAAQRFAPKECRTWAPAQQAPRPTHYSARISETTMSSTLNEKKKTEMTKENMFCYILSSTCPS